MNLEINIIKIKKMKDGSYILECRSYKNNFRLVFMDASYNRQNSLEKKPKNILGKKNILKIKLELKIVINLQK